MKLNWINYKELFPCINVNLMNEVLELSLETKVVSLKFAKNYNLQYIGELAERWHERNIVQSNEDLLGLIMGISHCTSGTFLYDQTQLFIKSVCSYLKVNWSPVSAAAILNYGKKELEKIPELCDIRDMLVQSDGAFSNQSERILTISLLAKMYGYTRAYTHKHNDELRAYILMIIDGVQLNFTRLYTDYPLLLLLSDVYTDLRKPTAKEFKTKGMSRVLQVISALRTKEITQDQDYHLILGTNRESISILNYFLAFENSGHNHSITGPGFARIKENFLNYHFYSGNDVPSEFVAIVDRMIKAYGKSSSNSEIHPLQSLLNELSHEGVSRFQNSSNLKLLIKQANSILMKNINESYFILIKENVVEGSVRESIIEILLTGYYLNKKEFEYLEYQRIQANQNITVNSTYTAMCLENGHISLENIEDLEQRGMVSFVIDILKRKQDHEQLVSLLERVKVNPYHKFLVELDGFTKLKAKSDDSIKKRLYPLYLNALYTFKASKYAAEVYDIVRNIEFIELFGVSVPEIDDIERQLYTNDFMHEKEAKIYREKHMTDEELEEVRTQELCQQLKKCTRYRIENFAENHWRKIAEHDVLRKTFIEQMISLELKDKFDMGGYLMLFYQLRAKNVLSPEEIQLIDAAALQKIEKFNLS